MADPDVAPRERRAVPGARSGRTGTQKGARAKGRARPTRHYVTLAAAVLLACIVAGILMNALVLQRTRHPAPLLGRPAASVTGTRQAPAAVPVPAPRPEPQRLAAPPANGQAGDKTVPEKPMVEAPLAPRPRQAALPQADIPEARQPDPIAKLLKAGPREAKTAPPAEPRRAAAEPRRIAPAEPKRAASAVPRPAPSAAPDRSVLAAQRALVKLGFVLEADGIAGQATRKAIERYERERGLPVKGDLSRSLLRRLEKESGVAID